MLPLSVSAVMTEHTSSTGETSTDMSLLTENPVLLLSWHMLQRCRFLLFLCTAQEVLGLIKQLLLLKVSNFFPDLSNKFSGLLLESFLLLFVCFCTSSQSVLVSCNRSMLASGAAPFVYPLWVHLHPSHLDPLQVSFHSLLIKRIVCWMVFPVPSWSSINIVVFNHHSRPF